MRELKDTELEQVVGGTDLAGSSWLDDMLRKIAKKSKELLEEEYEKRN